MEENNKKDLLYEEALDPQENEKLKDYFLGIANTDFVRIGPRKFLFPKELIPKIINFPLREDDTFVVTYPKSVMWGPYFEHVLEAWENRENPNILFLFYEDFIKDLPSVIRKVAVFLGKSLSEDQLDKLVYHLHIDNFKKNKSINMEDLWKHGIFSGHETFIRRGKAGGWRDHFDEEMTAEADAWIEKHLRDTDFRFPQC